MVDHPVVAPPSPPGLHARPGPKEVWKCQHYARAVSAMRPRATGEPLPGLEGVKVTLVLPCLNEELAVGSCVARAFKVFEESHLEGYVLVVDNGSSDGSVEVARKAGARVVRQVEPGYGAALRS